MNTTVQRRFRRRIFITLSIVAILFALHWIGLLKPLERIALRATSGLLRITHIQNLSFGADAQEDTVGALSPAEMEETITQQRKELQELRLTVAEQQQAIAQSTLAQDQLEYIKEIGKSGVVTRVIGKSAIAGVDTVIVNKGEKDGVRKGQAVLGGSVSLVGIVTRVEHSTSVIELMTSPRFRANASIQNEPSSPGIVTGTFQLGTIMEYIPQFDPLETGQAILTNGKDDAIPAGIPIGSVERVEGQPGTVFQRAYVKPYTDVERAQILTIVSPL